MYSVFIVKSNKTGRFMYLHTTKKYICDAYNRYKQLYHAFITLDREEYYQKYSYYRVFELFQEDDTIFIYVEQVNSKEDLNNYWNELKNFNKDNPNCINWNF